MTVLFVEDDDLIRELFSTELEAELDVEIVELNSGNKAIEYLKSNSDVTLIISDYHMSDGNGGDLYDYLQSNQLNIPVIMATSEAIKTKEEFKHFEKDHPHNFHLEKPYLFKELLRPVLTILQKEVSDDVPAFCRVKTVRFMKINNICCDIYLKLSGEKHVKIIHANELYESQQLQKYLDRNIKYLHVTRKDFVAFNNDYTNTLEAMFNHKKQSISEKTEAQLTGVAYVHETILNLGIDKKVVTMVDKVIKSSLTMMLNKEGDISDLLGRFMRNKNFIYEHSLITAYMSTAIAAEMNWTEESTAYKLSLAAILHDISWEGLYEHIDEDLIETFSYQSLKKYPRKVKELVKQHPIDAAMMIRGTKSFPPDVDWIVEQHHELPDGSGFPRGLKAKNIFPLAAIFILADTFARRIYGQKIDASLLNTVKDEFISRYCTGSFKKPLTGFLTLF